MVKCIRRAVIFGVSYTQTLHLQKYFTYGRGFNLSLNFTDMDTTDRTEAISRSLVSSRGLGRSVWKWAVIEVDKWKRRKMTESSDDRQDEFSITGETTLNISKIIQGFLHGTGDLMGMAIQ